MREEDRTVWLVHNGRDHYVAMAYPDDRILYMRLDMPGPRILLDRQERRDENERQRQKEQQEEISERDRNRLM